MLSKNSNAVNILSKNQKLLYSFSVLRCLDELTVQKYNGYSLHISKYLQYIKFKFSTCPEYFIPPFYLLLYTHYCKNKICSKFIITLPTHLQPFLQTPEGKTFSLWVYNVRKLNNDGYLEGNNNKEKAKKQNLTYFIALLYIS